MKRFWLGLALAIGMSLLHSAAFAKSKDAAADGFVVLEEPGAAGGSLDTQKLSECLRLAVRELGLDNQPLPTLVFYHISQPTAHQLGIGTNSVWRSSGGGHLRYEMWIVDHPSPYIYSYMLASVLERHFQLPIDDEARSRIIARIERSLNATVDAHSFR